MTLTPTLLAHLSALRAAATPGPIKVASYLPPHSQMESFYITNGESLLADILADDVSFEDATYWAVLVNAAPDLISAAQERDALRAENDRLREALTGALKDIDDLIEHSTGVAGLHLNGDVAPWSDLLGGG